MGLSSNETSGGKFQSQADALELPCYTQDRNLPTQPNTCIHITIKISLQTYTGKKPKATAPRNHIPGNTQHSNIMP